METKISKLYKKYLILGHARSGTQYMATLFNANGIKIGHECIGEEGTSNWQMVVKANEYPYATDKITRKDVDFETVIHVMREPLAAIASIFYTEEGSMHFRKKYAPINGNNLERAIISYASWTKMIQAQQPDITVKLEEAYELFGPDRVYVTPQNKRLHPQLTMSIIYSKVDDAFIEMYYELMNFYNSIKTPKPLVR